MPNKADEISSDYEAHHPYFVAWKTWSWTSQRQFSTFNELQSRIENNLKCEEIYRYKGKLRDEKQFDDSVICLADHGSDLSLRDTGGSVGLVRNTVAQPVFIQVGIVSHMEEQSPFIATRVTKFIDWIEEAIRN